MVIRSNFGILFKVIRIASKAAHYNQKTTFEEFINILQQVEGINNVIDRLMWNQQNKDLCPVFQQHLSSCYIIRPSPQHHTFLALERTTLLILWSVIVSTRSCYFTFSYKVKQDKMLVINNFTYIFSNLKFKGSNSHLPMQTLV